MPATPFSSWPRMGDAWFPEGGWRDASGFGANLIDNPIVVQFVHRWFAWIAAAAALWLAFRARVGWAVPVVAALVAVADRARHRHPVERGRDPHRRRPSGGSRPCCWRRWSGARIGSGNRAA
jgi:hypothetical protein